MTDDSTDDATGKTKAAAAGAAEGSAATFNHLAIAVPDLEAARARFAEALGLVFSAPQDQPDHGVRVAFLTLGGVKIELMQPLGDASPIAGFLERNPRGGLHHLCLGVENLGLALDQAAAAGARIASGPAVGAHGAPVAFLHPADLCGLLVELEEGV